MKLGIIGGRFDPVHIGHLILANDVMDNLSLDRIIFMLSYTPPHKETFLDFNSRYELLKRALSDYEQLEASDFERKIKLPTSYTALVLDEYKKRFPERDLYFILGEDQFLDIDNWYKPEILFDKAQIVVLKRNENKIKSSYLSRVLFVNRRIIEISSTEIRNRIKRGLSITNFVPKAVEQIIVERRFYR